MAHKIDIVLLQSVLQSEPNTHCHIIFAMERCSQYPTGIIHYITPQELLYFAGNATS